MKVSPDDLDKGVRVLQAQKLELWRKHVGWGPHFGKDLRQRLAAVESGNADELDRLMLADNAAATRKKLLLASNATGNKETKQECVGYSLVTSRDLAACPAPAANTVLAMMSSTHPTYEARLARIAHLAGRADIQLRATAPPVPVGGHYSTASVPQQVADELAKAPGHEAPQATDRRRRPWLPSWMGGVAAAAALAASHPMGN